uniref:Uncharacterized protein n=1 Tax=Mus spicilegus TaxID=10103 RepID=A0A8C6IDP4_MUSSI
MAGKWHLIFRLGEEDLMTCFPVHSLLFQECCFAIDCGSGQLTHFGPPFHISTCLFLRLMKMLEGKTTQAVSNFNLLWKASKQEMHTLIKKMTCPLLRASGVYYSSRLQWSK